MSFNAIIASDFINSFTFLPLKPPKSVPIYLYCKCLTAFALLKERGVEINFCGHQRYATNALN